MSACGPAAAYSSRPAAIRHRPAGHRQPRPGAMRHRVDDRNEHQIGERHRQEPQGGRQRALAALLLERKAVHQQQAVDAEGHGERRDQGGGQPAAAEQVQRQHRRAARRWLATNAASARDGDDGQRDESTPGASVRPSTRTMRQRAEAEHRQHLTPDVDPRGLVVPGFGQVEARHQQRQQTDGHVQPEDVAPADGVGQHAAEDRSDRGAHRGGHRPRRRGPAAFDRIGERCGGDGQALRQHQCGADALDRPRRQQQGQRRCGRARPARRR